MAAISDVSPLLSSLRAQIDSVRIVRPNELTMYDEPLLQDLKQFTVEELYEKLDQEIDKMIYGKKQPAPLEGMLTYLSELYRRGIPCPVEWWEYDVLRCHGNNCRKEGHLKSYEIKLNYNPMYEARLLEPGEPVNSQGFCVKCAGYGNGGSVLSKEKSIEVHELIVRTQFGQSVFPLRDFVKDELAKLKKIKAFQLASIKKPRVYEEINDLIDAILDANGNKISEFKEYLSPEHYRIIRAGRDISEIKEQDELLRCLRTMKK